MSNKKFYFSPSEYHHCLIDNAQRKLSYDGGDIRKWQARLRRKLKTLLGDMPEKRIPLNARSIWKTQNEYGSVEKIVFSSEPHCDVPAYICLPANIKPPYPIAICLQGHSTGMHNSIGVDRDNEKKKIKAEGDRDYAIGCMKRGLAALCIEQRSFGFRRELRQKAISPHGCHDAVMHSLQLGKTLLGERIYDVDRGIDYLASRNDVDMKSVCVMGNSGGGTVSIYAAALLPRISFAMPSCSFCTFRDSIMSIYHCSDNYVPGIMKYAEMSDVMGLFAPKPLVIVCGRNDEIFPLSAVKKAFTDLKSIYKAAGTEKHCHLVIGNEGHRFYADEAWPVMLSEMKRR